MTLTEGLQQLPFTLPDDTAEKLDYYLALLAKWNRVYNLTAIREAGQMVTHHILDSLVVLPYLSDVGTLVDVGSGPGLPGLSLAICRPDLMLTSVESNQKKAAFQQQVKIELGLDNVSVFPGRAEALAGRYDGAIARAFSGLGKFVATAGHLSDRLFAMKGTLPKDEIADLPAGWTLAKAIKLQVPGLDSERHLLAVERV